MNEPTLTVLWRHKDDATGDWHLYAVCRSLTEAARELAALERVGHAARIEETELSDRPARRV